MIDVEKISIQVHPRAFSAFGADLVTNDAVAITELIKNCYDAFAFNVEVKFGRFKSGSYFIDIKDDGLGMTRDIIKTAWAVIATPYKQKNPIVRRNGFVRRVSGNKGLGRFSAARLGSKLTMITKSKDDTCLNAKFDWDELSNSENIDECFLTISENKDNIFESVGGTGTIIRIKDLQSTWDEEKIEKLSDDLSRLISPFEKVDNFSIKIISKFEDHPVEVTPPRFINKPLYRIDGKVDKNGTIDWHYYYNSHKDNREISNKIPWLPKNDFFEQLSLLDNFTKYTCGPFSFEIRAWDLDADSIADVSETFDLKKSDIRKSISLYKGLSVYRDNILVLPKSEASRDWLGLDLKRVSNVGRRMSTSQIVGIINVSAEENPEIKDTTDREKLVDTNEYKQFVQIANDIIDKLQYERLKDKKVNQKRANLSDLITPLSSKNLLERAESAAELGHSTGAIIKYIKEYDEQNEKNLSELNSRLVYYAQTASLGSIAIVILHEFLTGMTAIKRFLNQCKPYIKTFDEKTNEYLEDANIGHKRVSEVAQSFAPLYRKDLRKQNNVCDLADIIQKSIRLIKAKKISKDIDFKFIIPENVNVCMHEGELQTIFINLFDNACYWIQEAKKQAKLIAISVENTPLSDRINVVISDNGVGVLPEEAARIFNPGITSKPHGIGMGLVIVSELLNYYDGKIGVRIPSDIDGATFVFDVPVR